MELTIKIKSHYVNNVVAFLNSNGRSLGELPQEDLQALAKIGLESGDKSILDLFEKLPNLADLKRASIEARIKKNTT